MRKSLKPWFRAQTNTWYVTHRGRQIPLAKGRENRAEATRAFHRLMVDEGQLAPAGRAVRGYSVPELLDLFLDHSRRHNKPNTFELYRHFLQDFAAKYPALPVRDLKPFHVSQWLDGHATWTTARCGAVGTVKRAFKWAADEGLIEASPVKSVKKPPMPRRERILSAAEQTSLVDAATDANFRHFLIALRETGARPGEVASVEAGMVDWVEGVWVLAKHKTAAKTGRPRVIYMTPALVELTRQLAEEHPKGPLFRNRDGEPWSRNAIRCRFRRLREKLKLGSDVVAYSFRHTFATDALANEVPAAAVAELLGHSDLAMLAKHYSKLGQKRDYLRKAARQAVGGSSV